MLNLLTRFGLALAVLACTAGTLEAQPASNPIELVKEGRQLNAAGK